MTETHTPLHELLRELSKVIVDHLGGGSEWFTRVGDDFYVDPKAIGPELRRRKTDAQITKKALFRANTRADSHHRLVEALTDVGASLAAAISLLERGGKAAKKAAPSDRMFDQMVKDYSASLERARDLLAALKEAGR